MLHKIGARRIEAGIELSRGIPLVNMLVRAVAAPLRHPTTVNSSPLTGHGF